MKNNKAKCIRIFREKINDPSSLTRFSELNTTAEGKLLYEHLKRKLKRIPGEGEFSRFVDYHIRLVNRFYKERVSK